MSGLLERRLLDLFAQLLLAILLNIIFVGSFHIFENESLFCDLLMAAADSDLNVLVLESSRHQ